MRRWPLNTLERAVRLAAAETRGGRWRYKNRRAKDVRGTIDRTALRLLQLKLNPGLSA